MKLGFKSLLTRKRLFHINLRADFNSSFASNPGATIFRLGGVHNGSGAKKTCYRFGPFELNIAEESLARNGTRVKIQAPLPPPHNACRTAVRDRDPRGSPATPMAGKHLMLSSITAWV